MAANFHSWCCSWTTPTHNSDLSSTLSSSSAYGSSFLSSFHSSSTKRRRFAVCSLQQHSSSSTYKSPFLRSFHTPFTKRRRLFACSLHQHSSPSPPPPPSSSSSSGTSNSGPRLSKPVQFHVKGSTREKLRSSINDREDEKKGEEAPSTHFSHNPTPKRVARRFKSLLGKRSLWRRILFASRKVRSLIVLNVITLVYASNIPILKEVEAVMNPATFTIVRFTVSAIPFIPFVLRGWGDSRVRNAGMELGFWVSLGYLLQALGLQTSEAGRASFISMFTVIVVPILDGILGAVVPARTWFGALMSIVGVGMLESSGSPPNVGDLLNFSSAAFFGVHMLRTEHISRSISKKKFLALIGYEICIVALFSIVWYLVGGCIGDTQYPWASSFTWTTLRDWMVDFPWIPAIYTGIFSTGLCLWVEMDAMRDISATETAIIYGMEPVWGAGFAWFLLGERWGPTGWIGAALVLGGSVTVMLFGSSSDSKEEHTKKARKVTNIKVSD